MKKQLRILIGDTGSVFAVSMANAFVSEGDWAIVRPQNPQSILEALEKEHPDILILNADPVSDDLLEYIPELRSRFRNLTVFALLHRRSSYTEKLLREMGIICRRFPENPAEMRREIRDYFRFCGSSLLRFDVSEPELCLSRLLQAAGVPANLQGFHFLRSAIRHALKEPYCSGCMMHRIYPAVAEEMNSTPTRVERSIRNAIAHAWDNVQQEGGCLIFPDMKRRLTNSEFIACAVEYLRVVEQQYLCG
ncbi:MAG: sporulation initiation factor Spo0A C-terminal domain-containing protein [Oscillospiraceae bacterium]|nr:sporulation initiation factor Spo0A C-terminal domain-containing protein [Oscillospiraceae bacterium]